ncbi:MAG: hypothetical protein AB7Q00_00205 [Phycisphaerales bacterium]
MPLNTPEDWTRFLLHAANQGLPAELRDAPVSGDHAKRFVDRFSDELGHRRTLDRPLLSRLLGLDVESPTPPACTAERLWWSVVGNAEFGLDARAIGPLCGVDERATIETWTEDELAGLHALADLAAAGRHDAWRRARHHMHWLIAELQPDNATAHPWGVHALAALAIVERNAEARHYAEALVHHSFVNMGRPDRFSACILLDAARTLDTLVRVARLNSLD